MELEQALESIRPASEQAMEQAWAHWNDLALPLHVWEDCRIRWCGLQE